MPKYDILGQEMQLGDKVVFSATTRIRDNLRIGKVSRFMSKLIEVSYKSGIYNGLEQVYPHQCVVVNKIMENNDDNG